MVRQQFLDSASPLRRQSLQIFLDRSRTFVGAGCPFKQCCWVDRKVMHRNFFPAR